MIIVSKLGFCLKLFRENLTWLLLNLLEENVFGSNSTLHADFVATVDQRKIHRHWNSPFRFPSLVVLFLRFIQIYQNCIIEISYCLPSNQPQTGLVLLLCFETKLHLIQWFCEKNPLIFIHNWSNSCLRRCFLTPPIRMTFTNHQIRLIGLYCLENSMNEGYFWKFSKWDQWENFTETLSFYCSFFGSVLLFLTSRQFCFLLFYLVVNVIFDNNF